MFRTKVSGPNFDDIIAGAEREVAAIVTAAMRDTTDDVKEAFRDQVRGAGLGNRLPNAIRGVSYPKNRNSLEPAGWVYAQPSRDGRGAAAIIESYASGANIVPRGGRRLLAVPTDDTPLKRGRSPMSPAEVEAKFGRRLVYIDANDKGFRTPSVRGRAVGFLVIKNVLVRKSNSGWRNPTARERAGRTRFPRPLQAVIMFRLVRSVKKPQSIDLSAPQSVAIARFDANLSARWK